MLIRRSTRVVGGCVGLLGADVVVLSQFAGLTIYSSAGHVSVQKASKVEFLSCWRY